MTARAPPRQRCTARLVGKRSVQKDTSVAYQADISRSNPGCFLFLLDQSGSMADGFAGGNGHSKADELATIINRLLASLVIRCSKDEGVRNYFDVGVIGYGARVAPALASAPDDTMPDCAH